MDLEWWRAFLLLGLREGKIKYTIFLAIRLNFAQILSYS